MTKTKTNNIENQLKKAPSIAITYRAMLESESDAINSVTAFVQEFKGATLEKFDALNIQLHQFENWKFRSKNGIKCSSTATAKPKSTATKLSVIRTYLKHGEKITKTTKYEHLKAFQNALNSTDDSPEVIAKKKITKELKGKSQKELKLILDFISKI